MASVTRISWPGPQRRVAAFRSAHEGPKLRAECFVPRGRSEYCIYAVELAEHRGVVKVGRSARWQQRRTTYADWNFAKGNGISRERVFRVTEEFVDLAKLEAHILASLPFSIRHGREWFEADLDDVTASIEAILQRCGLSYV